MRRHSLKCVRSVHTCTLRQSTCNRWPMDRSRCTSHRRERTSETCNGCKRELHLLVALARTVCRQRSHAAHLCARRGGARALLIRQLQRVARSLRAESAQRQHRCWRATPQRAGRVCVVVLASYNTTCMFRSTKASRRRLAFRSRRDMRVSHASVPASSKRT